MKITIQPTQDQSGLNHKFHTVSIETPYDDLNITEVMDLIKSALMAWGFSECIITDHTN